MADKRIPALTELAATPASGDKLVIVDVSDTTDHATGTTKFVTRTRLVGSSTYPFTSSTSNPSSAPSSVGQLHLNTSTLQLWMGTGVGATSDWKELLLGGSP